MISNHPAGNIKPVVLDARLSTARAQVDAEVRRILARMVREAVVSLHQRYYYRVDLGAEVQPAIHIVTHDLFCTCTLGADCPAVTAVKYSLQKGTCPTAETPFPGYFPTAPHRCPVCGSKAHFFPALSSRGRGAGWRCEKGGSQHYWQHQAHALQLAFARKWEKLAAARSSAATPSMPSRHTD